MKEYRIIRNDFDECCRLMAKTAKEALRTYRKGKTSTGFYWYEKDRDGAPMLCTSYGACYKAICREG